VTADIIDLSDYVKVYTWIGQDPDTKEFFVITENEADSEIQVEGPFDTAEDAQRAMDAWAERTQAIRHDGNETMQ